MIDKPIRKGMYVKQVCGTYTIFLQILDKGSDKNHYKVKCICEIHMFNRDCRNGEIMDGWRIVDDDSFKNFIMKEKDVKREALLELL